MKYFCLSNGFEVGVLTTMHIITCRQVDLSTSRFHKSSRPENVMRCEVFALMPKDERRKLETCPGKCIFLSYDSDGNIGYWLRDLKAR